MGNQTNGNFKIWPLMVDELAPPEPPQHRTPIEDDTIISYGQGEYTFGLTLAQEEDVQDYHDLFLQEENNQFDDEMTKMAKDLDDIVPKYLLMHLLESN